MHRAAVKLVVVLRDRLYCDILAAFIGSRRGFEVICATTSVDHALSVCRRQSPHVIVLDASLVSREDGYDVASFLSPGGQAAVLLLDEAPDRRRPSGAPELPAVRCLTPNISGDELVEAIVQLAPGQSASGAGDPPQPTPDGVRPRDKQHPALSKLTAREREVLRLLALGNTVREVAEILGIAPNTVDNHKSRLMRKLGLHRMTELVRFAVRAGVIAE